MARLIRSLLAIAVLACLGCGQSSSGGSSGGGSPAAPIVMKVPITPGNLVATATSSTQVQLTWADYAMNEAQYQVERSFTGVSYSPIGAVAANVTSLLDSGLYGGATYWYRVRGVNAAGASGYSNVASA